MVIIVLHHHHTKNYSLPPRYNFIDTNCIMPAQNAFLLSCNRAANGTANCFCREACRRHSIEQMVAVRTEHDLHQEYRSIENFQEDHLTDMWDLTLQQIITGYSLYRKCTTFAGLTSFGPSLSYIPYFQQMQPIERKKLCRKISIIKGIVENWSEIVTNVTHHSMVYVDVRRFSVNQLSKCIKFDWVKDYNENNAPKDQRVTAKPNPEYPRHLIDLILTYIDNSGILDLINHDPEQVKLIARDLLSGMLARGDVQ